MILLILCAILSLPARAQVFPPASGSSAVSPLYASYADILDEAPCGESNNKQLAFINTEADHEALMGICNGSEWIWRHSQFGMIAPPVLAGTSWFNQTSATFDQDGAGALLTGTAAGGGVKNIQARVMAVPDTPYMQVGCFEGYQTGSNYVEIGMLWSDGTNAASSKIVTTALVTVNTNYLTFHQKYTNATTFPNTGYSVTNLSIPGSGFCLALQDDGSTRTVAISHDKATWAVFGSEAHTDYLTPTHIGFYVNSNESGKIPKLRVVHWETTASAPLY